VIDQGDDVYFVVGFHTVTDAQIITNEAKVRQSTKSLVLGKAKVMSYEGLEKARAKRADKEAAKEAKGKGKHSRKRKSAALEADTPEPIAKVVRMSEAPAPARASVV